MLSIKPIIINSKKMYELRVEVRGKAGKRRSCRRRYSSEREAKREGLKLLKELDGSKNYHTWEEWAKICIDSMKMECRASTIISYEGIVKKWINPHWKNLSLDEITRSEIHDLVFHKVQGVSQSTRSNILKRIKKILDMALSEGLIPNNPALGLKVKIPETHQKVLNASEISTLLYEAKAFKHRFYEAWAFAILTGMRSGELYALRWSNVDFDNGFIHVVQSWSNKNGFGPTKSARNRVVPISSECDKFLKELRLKSRGEFVLPRLKEWEHGDQAKILRSFCEGIGTTPVRFHDLRATFITQMLTRGVALAKVMSIVGHSELKTTQGYLRLCGQDLKGATDDLGVTIPSDIQGADIISFKNGK